MVVVVVLVVVVVVITIGLGVGLGCAGVGESASALFGEPPDGQIVLMPAPNGHLKCTCLPSSASLMEDKMRDVEEVSAALAEVSTASHHSKLQFNDEIQVVEEEENEEGTNKTF